jgi:hypothetical protein
VAQEPKRFSYGLTRVDTDGGVADVISRVVVGWVVAAICVLLLLISGAYSFITHAGTNYPENFSHKAWRRITNGMATATVRELLGRPLSSTNVGNNTVVWRYANDCMEIFRRHDLVISNRLVIEKRDWLERAR